VNQVTTAVSAYENSRRIVLCVNLIETESALHAYMYLRKNLIHILCFLAIKELNNEDDMGQLKHFITYYNIIANKILKSNIIHI
jgi:hypothetical protein